MKKLSVIALTFFAALVFAAAGCSDSKTPDQEYDDDCSTDTDKTDEAETAFDPKSVKAGDACAMPDKKICINSVACVSCDGLICKDGKWAFQYFVVDGGCGSASCDYFTYEASADGDEEHYECNW